MNQIKILLAFVAVYGMTFYLPAKCEDNRYDRLLAIHEIKNNRQQNDIEDIDKLLNSEEVNKEVDKSKKYSLGFQNGDFPDLDGTWQLTKRTLGRRINPILHKPIYNVHCNARLPFEMRDIEKKEVIISARGPGYFKVNTKYPHTRDVYFDPNLDKNIEYHNFGFKAIIDSNDLTYAYTIKLDDFIQERTIARQLWLRGRLNYEHVSSRKIVARGYEIEYTPECLGYIFDEVEFTFVKIKDAHPGPLAPAPGIPIFEQAAYAAEPILPEEKEIKGIKKYLELPKLDSAKDKSGFKPAAHYKPLDIAKPGVKIPGLW